jgi:hypothetical protein
VVVDASEARGNAVCRLTAASAALVRDWNFRVRGRGNVEGKVTSRSMVHEQRLLCGPDNAGWVTKRTRDSSWSP